MTFNVFAHTREWFLSEKVSHTAEPVTASTNEQAKAEAFSLAEPTHVYVTDQQSAGRGRGSNSWLNPLPGHSLMITYSFAVEIAPQPITAPLMGLAVYSALKAVWPEGAFALKAPNDILLKGQKICGILTETVQMGAKYRLIVGLGLNVFSHPQDVDIAGHLTEQVTVTQTQWNEFLQKLTMHLQWAAQGSQTAHLGEGDRRDLLEALNRNPHLEKSYVSLTPFGDLVTDTETISWRSL